MTELLKKWHSDRPTVESGTDPIAEPEAGSMPEAEAAVVNLVEHQALVEDHDAKIQLNRLKAGLFDSAHETVARLARLTDLTDEHHARTPRRRNSARGRPDEGNLPTSTDDGEGDWADPHREMVSGRTLLGLEVILLIVEVFFWYSVFSSSVDRRLGWLAPERLQAVLLALFIPLIGIAAARLLAAMGHRWFVRYPGMDRRRHLGTIIPMVTFASVLVAIVWLIHERFAHPAFGSKAIAAPLPMAIIFGAALLIDLCGRLFLTSEIRRQHREVLGEFRKRREALIRANKAHWQAWCALCEEVQDRRGRIGRFASSGRGLVTEAGAEHGRPGDRRTFLTRGSTLEPKQRRDGSTLGAPSADAVIPVVAKVPMVPHPVLDDAIKVLNDWEPMPQSTLNKVLEDARSALYGRPVKVEPASTAPVGPGPAPQTVNGQSALPADLPARSLAGQSGG